MSLTCSSDDLKIKPQSVCMFIGCSSTGKSVKMRSFLLQPDIFFQQPPKRIIYVHRFNEPEFSDLKKIYKRNIEFITWPLSNTAISSKKKPHISIVGYLTPKLAPGTLLVLDDVQVRKYIFYINVFYQFYSD